MPALLTQHVEETLQIQSQIGLCDGIFGAAMDPIYVVGKRMTSEWCFVHRGKFFNILNDCRHSNPA